MRCVVAMWGPDVGDDPIQLHGVVLCPGRDLAAWLASPDSCLDDAQREIAVALDAYVTSRDVGELRKHGAVPTSVGAMVNQGGLIVTAVVATAYVTALAGRLPLPAVSILAMTGVMSAAALWWRRATASGFVHRLSMAILTTSLGLGAILVGVPVVSIWTS